MHQDSFANVAPRVDEPLSAELLSAIGLAFSKDNKKRDIEPLCVVLRNGNASNEKEGLGLMRNVEQSKVVSRSARSHSKWRDI